MTPLSRPAAPSRPPAVAGLFYPASPGELRRQVDELLASARSTVKVSPKALIAPHAGYMYSGAVAATAYATLAPGAEHIRRVVLLGPAHRVAVRGVALPAAAAYDTPLGAVPIDADAVRELTSLTQVSISDHAHAEEHSLEVHLPFLQQVLGPFTLVPLAVGDATTEEIAEVLDRLWGGDETLVIVSSDLSHYLPYAVAQATDRRSVETMLGLAPTLNHAQACGATPVNGLLAVARRRGLMPRLLDLRNSGDTSGERGRVVGYAALALFEPAPAAEADRSDTASRGAALLAHARAAIAQRLGLDHATPPSAAFLDEPGATFVTVRVNGRLRGCVGTLSSCRLLRDDVSRNAIAAAFEDSRFEPVAAREYGNLSVEVSLLSPPARMPVVSERELLAQLRPGIDGLTLEWGQHRGTFLPQVWESLPQPADFVLHLKRKAGLAAGFWADDVAVSRYTVEKFIEGEAK